MFTSKTQQGYEIVAQLKLVGANHIVFKRRDNNFGWGSYYNEETGGWAQGHYDYSDPNLALQDLIEFALGKSLIPEGERSFKGELEAYAKRLAEEDLCYKRFPLDCTEEFIEEFTKDKYYLLDEAFEVYKEERERLVDID